MPVPDGTVPQAPRDALGVIRTAARALLLQDGAVLAIQYVDKQGAYYALPGGGQREGESLHQTLLRECREEIGVDVAPGDLLFVREWIDPTRTIHQVEFVFSATATRITRVASPVPDGDQVGIEWLPLSTVAGRRLYPLEIRTFLSNIAGGATPPPVYLGART